jgi:cyclic pyranopterin phosphate synthase
MGEMTHFNGERRARMVDVTDKPATDRSAEAEGFVRMNAETLALIRGGAVKKGDVLAVAQVAGVMAAKRTWELVPMCHPLALTIYDMCKAVQRDMELDSVRLVSKSGGKSGVFHRDAETGKGAAWLGKVVSVNVSEKKGLRKHAVDAIELKLGVGIAGDAHAGNWHRQVSLLSEESVDTMRAMGLDALTPGAFAENINTVGIELKTLPVGTRLAVGDCLLAVTQIGKECHNDGCAIQKATGRCVMPTDGIFAVVLRGGTVRGGDTIEVVTDG